MRTLARFVVVAASLIVLHAHAAGSRPTVPQQIRSDWHDMQAAANAHDTDRFMAAFARSPGLVFAVNGEVIRGWGALHAQQLKWWHHGKSDARYTPDGAPEFVRLCPDIVVSTASFTSLRTGDGGKASTGRFVVTYVWKKLPQGWRIVYGHESWAKPPG